MVLFRKRKPSEQQGIVKALPDNPMPPPQSRSTSELVGNVPEPTLTKSPEQLELELARKNSQIRELQDQNQVWQEVAARTTHPNFSPGVAPPSPSVATISSLSNREPPQRQQQLEGRHDYAPEVVVENRQVGTLTPWNPLVPPRLESDVTESASLTPPDSVATDLQSMLGPSIAKVAHAIEVLVETRPDAGLAVLLSATTLCLTTIYVLYSIIYAHMGYVLIGFLAVVSTYSIGRYLFIIKQTEIQVKQGEVQVKREEVQQEWIRSIGSKLQHQLPADPWSQPVHGARALMPAENLRIEELVD